LTFKSISLKLFEIQKIGNSEVNVASFSTVAAILLATTPGSTFISDPTNKKQHVVKNNLAAIADGCQTALFLHEIFFCHCLA
jgi:hypothetical protein